MIELRVTALSAGYRGRPVIGGLELDPIPAGMVVALIGPNAAGKSTLFKALAGLVTATGSVRLGAIELLGLPARARAGLLGYLPQNLPAATGLTVLEAVIAALRAPGLPEADAAPPVHRALHALDRLGVADLSDNALHRLSGGQRQLVGLAAAIVREPQLLLLDEPTSALDLYHQVRVMEEARSLAAAGRIVVMVLHDLALAARWADRIVVLHEGRIVASGPPLAAVTPAVLASVYGVSARVEPCSRGFPQIIVDERLPDPHGIRGQRDE